LADAKGSPVPIAFAVAEEVEAGKAFPWIDQFLHGSPELENTMLLRMSPPGSGLASI
jgi:hypothetical protein